MGMLNFGIAIFSATKSQTKSAKTLSNFLDELDESQIFCDTELTTRFLCLGRLGYQEECLDNFVRLQQKGISFDLIIE